LDLKSFSEKRTGRGFRSTLKDKFVTIRALGGDIIRNRDYIANAQLRLHENRGFFAHPRRVSR
jgi:hypothetical protein